MSEMEAAYNRKEKHEKQMCKHCKSTAHSTLEHRKHYKNFREEKKQEREKHFKEMFEPEEHETKEEPAKKHRKDMGVEAGAGEDLKKKHEKSFNTSTKHSGSFEGKSNALGHGGRAAQLRARGVPGGVIGAMARRAHAAPGQENYHPSKKHRKGMSEADAGSMRGYDPNLGVGKAGMRQLAKPQPSRVMGNIGGGKFAKRMPKKKHS